MPAMVIMVVGIVVWTLLALFSKVSADTLFMAVGLPFWLSALYGSIAIYNVRAKHGIRMFVDKWWLITSAIAIAWALFFTAISLMVTYAFQTFGLIDRELTLEHAANFLLFGVGLALAISLIPAKDPIRYF